ncbi:MAG: 50S ribosomal protein L13 [Thermoplasmata archaeon]|nr:50S ribosomal protein L13 [Thermoplasmata archaeon]
MADETPVPASTPATSPAPVAPKPKTSSPKPKTAAKAAARTPKAAPKPAAKAASAPTKPTGVPTHVAPPKAPKGTVVDVSGLVLGRSASLIAKRLLGGESIIIIHAEKAVVTGSRASVLNFYIANRARGSVRSGPHYPRYPDRIYRRTVRGMLPHLKTRGKEAFDRLEVFIGCPAELSGVSHQSLDGAQAPLALRPALTLAEISRLLGARI